MVTSFMEPITAEGIEIVNSILVSTAGRTSPTNNRPFAEMFSVIASISPWGLCTCKASFIGKRTAVRTGLSSNGLGCWIIHLPFWPLSLGRNFNFEVTIEFTVTDQFQNLVKYTATRIGGLGYQGTPTPPYILGVSLLFAIIWRHNALPNSSKQRSYGQIRPDKGLRGDITPGTRFPDLEK